MLLCNFEEFIKGNQDTGYEVKCTDCKYVEECGKEGKNPYCLVMSCTFSSKEEYENYKLIDFTIEYLNSIRKEKGYWQPK